MLRCTDTTQDCFRSALAFSDARMCLSACANQDSSVTSQYCKHQVAVAGREQRNREENMIMHRDLPFASDDVRSKGVTSQ